jgi:hypothetical protein
MLAATRHLAIPRLVLCGAVLAAFLLTLLMAVSPELHDKLHHDADGDHHECLVTALHAGACDDAAPVPALASFIATLFEAKLPDETRAADSLFLSFRILEHAPPRRA